MRLHDDPNREWKNIFQLWKENGERLPFIVARNSWDAAGGSYLVVERIEIKKWPYGFAWGRYHYHGKPSGPQEKIKIAGTYAWILLTVGRPEFGRSWRHWRPARAPAPSTTRPVSFGWVFG